MRQVRQHRRTAVQHQQGVDQHQRQEPERECVRGIVMRMVMRMVVMVMIEPMIERHGEPRSDVKVHLTNLRFMCLAVR
jgi:hypothetical protein